MRKGHGEGTVKERLRYGEEDVRWGEGDGGGTVNPLLH